MKKLLLCLMLFTAPVSAADLVINFITEPTTQNLLALCASTDTDNKWVDHAMCTGYVMGTYEGADFHPESKLTPGVSFNTLYDTMRESLAQHPANKSGNRRLQPARFTLIESWVQAGLITFTPPQGNIVHN